MLCDNETTVILVRGIDTDPNVLDNPNYSCRSYIIDDGGIFYSKDPQINKFVYWQKFDPFDREYTNTFFKCCLKKRGITYLQSVIPDKKFIESTELNPGTSLFICKLRINHILNDKSLSNENKSKKIVDILLSYPLESVLLDDNKNHISTESYLTYEFATDMSIIIKGLNKKLYDEVFTEEDTIVSLAEYRLSKQK